MNILAIDPGTTESAYCLYDIQRAMPVKWAKVSNFDMLDVLHDGSHRRDFYGPDFGLLAVEMISSYGMPVGKEVFATCLWIGRFIERSGNDYYTRLVYRKDVKMHLTNSTRSKDAHVRQALIDRYGPGKELAIGKKATPGPLYGMTGDCWSALAVAITAAETSEPVAFHPMRGESA